MHGLKFDDSQIVWRVYNVDRENRIVDIIFKFAANNRVKLHRHLVPYITVVLQGELRLYRANGELKEIRPTGSYVSGVADGEPHTEGGGDEDAIVFFSNRNIKDKLYEFPDENGNPVISLSLDDFAWHLEDQGTPSWRNAKLALATANA